MASVAGLGIAMIAGGPATLRAFDLAPLSAAHAAEGHHLAGFADLVAKVKPAVISVRVKIEQTADTNGMGMSEGNNANPFPPGSPMQKFFQAILGDAGHV